MEEMFIRQKNLVKKTPEKVVVIGAGGIGSWIAYFFARAGAKTIVIADPDEIEVHNLNRTPFTLDQLGEKKVYALEELIYSFRDDVEVISIPEYVLDWREEFNGADIVIDARDTTAILPFADIKVTYDGEEITLMIKPNEFLMMGEGEGYTTVPSYVVPPVVLASIVVHLAVMFNVKELEPSVATKTITDVARLLGVRV